MEFGHKIFKTLGLEVFLLIIYCHTKPFQGLRGVQKIESQPPLYRRIKIKVKLSRHFPVGHWRGSSCCTLDPN